MTAKRFSCTDNGFIVDYESEQKVFNLYDVVDLLNELAEEKEELKLLLREVEHELTTLTGLTATDSTSIVKEDMEKYCLFRLDYTELLKKIDKVMWND